MTMIQQTNEAELEPVFQQTHGTETLMRFAEDLRMAHQAAQMLVTTSFVPQSYKGRPDEAAVAIVTGIELGLSPTAALRSIDIVNGTPALRAITLRALVQKHGHKIWVDESTSQRAIVKGTRKGTDTVEQSIWDMDRARQLGLAGKDNWKKQPTAMLLARATSELARLIDADGILGLAYTAEELQDQPKETPAPTPEKKPQKRVSRARKPEPAQVEPEQGIEPEKPSVDAAEGVAPVADEVTGEIVEEAPIEEPPAEEPFEFADDAFPNLPEGFN